MCDGRASCFLRVFVYWWVMPSRASTIGRHFIAGMTGQTATLYKLTKGILVLLARCTSHVCTQKDPPLVMMLEAVLLRYCGSKHYTMYNITCTSATLICVSSITSWLSVTMLIICPHQVSLIIRLY